MQLRDEMMGLLKEATVISAPVTEASHLYTDLCLDSLAFMRLLLKIEETFSITFDLLEMESCLQVGMLIALVEQKTGEVVS